MVNLLLSLSRLAILIYVGYVAIRRRNIIALLISIDWSLSITYTQFLHQPNASLIFATPLVVLVGYFLIDHMGSV